jgi:hypothetical protein
MVGTSYSTASSSATNHIPYLCIIKLDKNNTMDENAFSFKDIIYEKELMI